MKAAIPWEGVKVLWGCNATPGEGEKKIRSAKKRTAALPKLINQMHAQKQAVPITTEFREEWDSKCSTSEIDRH